MRNFRNLGLMTSLENDEAAAAAAANTAPPAEAPAETLESDLLEISKDNEELEEDEAVVDDAAEGAEQLEELQATVEAFLEQGGMTTQTATAVALAARQTREAFRLPMRPFLAIEGFEGTQTRVNTTRRAIEGFKDEIKEIWRKIVAYIKAGIEKIVAWYNKIFGAGEKMKRRAEEIRKRAVESSSKSLGDKKEIDNGNLYKQLQVNGRIPSGSTALNDLNALVKASVAQANDAKVRDAYVDIFETDPKSDQFAASLSKFVETLAGTTTLAPLFEKISDPKSAGFGEVPGDLERTKELPGGKAVLRSKGDGTGFDVLDGYSVRLGDYNPKAAASTSTKLPAMNVSDIEKLADQVQETANQLISFRGASDKITAAKKKISAAAEKLSNSAIDESDEEVKKVLRGMSKLASKIGPVLDQPMVSLSKYTVTTCTAFLNYADASLRLYK